MVGGAKVLALIWPSPNWGGNGAGAPGPVLFQSYHDPGIQDVGLDVALVPATTWRSHGHWEPDTAFLLLLLFIINQSSVGVYYLSSASCIHLCTALDYTCDLWKPCCSRDGKATGTENLVGDVAVPVPASSSTPLTLHCRKPISHSPGTDCSGHHTFSSFPLGNSTSRDEKIIT